MDDAEDLDVVTQLLEPTPPGSFLLSNTDVLPGTGSEVFPMEPVCNLQMFTQVWRSKAHYTNGNFDKQLQRMLQVSYVCTYTCFKPKYNCIFGLLYILGIIL